MGELAHFMHSIAYFAGLCGILSPIGAVIMRIEWIWPTDPKFTLGLLFVSIVGFAGQVCLTIGMQNETAVRASIALYSQVCWILQAVKRLTRNCAQIVFSVMFEIAIFHNVPQFLSILGISMIVSGALYVGVSISCSFGPLLR